MIIIVIGALLIVMLILFNLSSLPSIFIIALATLTGHLKPLREMGNDTKRNFLMFVSIASFAISIRIHLTLYGSNILLYFQQKFIETAFLTLLAFPLVTYTLWSLNIKKILGVILIGMLILSFLQAFTQPPLKTQPVNWDQIEETVSNRIIIDVESTATFMMESQDVEWMYYIGNGLNLKADIFRL